MPTTEEQIAAGRAFMRFRPETDESPSAQALHLPQPPLVKAPMREASIELPRDFASLDMRGDLLALLRDRRSRRVYTDEPLPLLELSFLLWATQGVKGIRGRAYATLRTVPSGGARHLYETYLLVRHVEGLENGAYHYLPMTHALEYLGAVADIEQAISEAACGQRWAAKAAVLFGWAAVPARAEWRYGAHAHRPALIDAGHIGENLYLACEALGRGTCGVAAYDSAVCARLWELDGEEEFIAYLAPVGTARAADLAAEQSFYAFVDEEGL